MASSSPDSSSPLYHSPCPSPSPPQAGAGAGAAASLEAVAVWSREEDKLFESALVSVDLGAPDCWERLAESVPGKDAASLKRHFDSLIADIELIEAGLVPSPAYAEPEEVLGQPVHAAGETTRSRKDSHRGGNNVHGATASSGAAVGPASGSTSAKAACSKSSEIERKKGTPWSEEEHKSFLLGLAKFGKGDWRSISRNFVRTRTPTQVASHAQKYFIRLNSIKKDRRRSSIHDITSVNGDATQSCQGPITGQVVSSHSPGSEGHVYGAAVGQPVSGTLCPTVGTPVIISSSGFPGPFVSGAPLPRPLVPGAPVGVLPPYSLAQPVPQPTSQQVGR